MIPWENLKLWYGYPLKDGSWPDVSKHLNDGAIIGGRWVENGIYFDGIDDYVNCGSHTSLLCANAVTVELLVKTPSNSAHRYILGKDNVTMRSYSMKLEITSDKYRFLVWSSASVLHDVFSNAGYQANKWQHVVGTYDGIIQKIYIDGKVQTDTDSWNGTIKSNPTLAFTLSNTGGTWYRGKIALTRIYDMSLTADQVKESYEQCYRLI